MIKRSMLVMCNLPKAWLEEKGLGIVLDCDDSSCEVKMIYPPHVENNTLIRRPEELIPIAENCDSSMSTKRVIEDRLPAILIAVLSDIQSIKDYLKQHHGVNE